MTQTQQVQRRVISALPLLHLLKTVNTVLKFAELNILLSLPKMRKIQMLAKTT